MSVWLWHGKAFTIVRPSVQLRHDKALASARYRPHGYIVLKPKLALAEGYLDCPHGYVVLKPEVALAEGYLDCPHGYVVLKPKLLLAAGYFDHTSISTSTYTSYQRHSSRHTSNSIYTSYQRRSSRHTSNATYTSYQRRSSRCIHDSINTEIPAHSFNYSASIFTITN